MKIKTYQALTMREALKSIKEELGPDAVILSTKEVRRGGHLFGLFSRPVIEVTAATDYAARATSGGGQAPVRNGVRSPTESVPAVQKSAFLNALHASIQSAGEAVDATPGPARQNHCASAAAGVERELRKQLEQIKAELRSLHAMVRSMEWKPVGDPKSDSSAPEERLYQNLVAQGVQPLTAESLLTETKSRLLPADRHLPVAWRQALHRTVTEHTKVSGPLLGPGEQKIVLFIGATGVGKTTTIAKLAAHYRVKEKRSVALITLDTYRMAAVEQLQTYAKVLGVTLDLALTRREALEGIRRRRSSELILIDTAGRSPMDAEGLNELKDLVTIGHPLETHLVLSATTSERDLLQALTRYARLPIDRLLFTKLDEASGFGGILDTMLLTGLALSYFSTGQRVPDDLELASPERLANLLLGGPVKPSGGPQASPPNESARRAHETAGPGRGPRRV